jgi:hypothetical protein
MTHPGGAPKSLCWTPTGIYPMVIGQPAAGFGDAALALSAVRDVVGQPFDAGAFLHWDWSASPDDIDWEGEVRIAVEGGHVA